MYCSNTALHKHISGLELGLGEFRVALGPFVLSVISKALILRPEEFTVFDDALFCPGSYREGQVALHVQKRLAD